MEHVIHSHVVKFLTSVNSFTCSEHGFQQGFSYKTQLAFFVNDISSSLDNIPVDAIFLNYQKAFDKVPHRQLLLKLSHLNPLVLEWIREFLINRQQFVSADDVNSTLSSVASSVP